MFELLVDRLRMHQVMMAPEPWTDWHTSVCDCFEDASTCKGQRGPLIVSRVHPPSVSVWLCRLLRLLVLPLPGVHGFIQVWGEHLPPAM